MNKWKKYGKKQKISKILKSALIISNPLAGKGKPLKIVNLVNDFLVEIGFDVFEYYTKNKNDYDGIKKTIIANSKLDLLIISGGDGTLNDVVNAVPDGFNTPIIILPCGSGNDFANYLYGKKSLIEILTKLNNLKTINIDIGACNGKKFINGLGIGFDGWVAQKAAEGVKFVHPALKYYIAILRGIFTFKSFETDIGKSLIIAIANGPTYGGGFKIAPGANPSDGFFDLWHIKPIATYKRAFYLDFIKKGKHRNDEITFEHKTIKEIIIKCNKSIPAHLDGEYFESTVFYVKMANNQLVFVI